MSPRAGSADLFTITMSENPTNCFSRGGVEQGGVADDPVRREERGLVVAAVDHLEHLVLEYQQPVTIRRDIARSGYGDIGGHTRVDHNR